MARANPFRFSTKYQDDETDLLYYGHRYYSASMGRWVSPDPLPDLLRFSVRLGGRAPRGYEQTRPRYLAAGNSMVSAWDYLGLFEEPNQAPINYNGCPSSFGGLDFQGFAEFDKTLHCAYAKCGPNYTYHLIKLGERLPDSERWVGRGPLDPSGFCLTMVCHKAIDFTVSVECGCTSATLFLDPVTKRQLKPPYVLTTGGKETVTPGTETVECSSSINGKSWWECNDPDKTL